MASYPRCQAPVSGRTPRSNAKLIRVKARWPTPDTSLTTSSTPHDGIDTAFALPSHNNTYNAHLFMQDQTSYPTAPASSSAHPLPRVNHDYEDTYSHTHTTPSFAVYSPQPSHRVIGLEHTLQETTHHPHPHGHFPPRQFRPQMHMLSPEQEYLEAFDAYFPPGETLNPTGYLSGIESNEEDGPSCTR